MVFSLVMWEQTCLQISGVWKNPSYLLYTCTSISTSQKKKLQQDVSNRWYWIRTTNCASFASEVFCKVMGTDVNADDYLPGIETPHKLGKSIQNKYWSSRQKCSLQPGPNLCIGCCLMPKGFGSFLFAYLAWYPYINKEILLFAIQ